MFKFMKNRFKKKPEAVTEPTEGMIPLEKVVGILEGVQQSLREEVFEATDSDGDLVDSVEWYEIENHLVDTVVKVREEYGLNV